MFNTFLNWSIAAILASITMMPISVNRQTAPTVEPLTEEAELRGCAANFADDDRIPFYFDPSETPTKANVETLDNWIYGVDPSLSCSEHDNEVACAILVDESFVKNLSTNPQLADGFTINAVATNPSNAYVTSSDDTSMGIYNSLIND